MKQTRVARRYAAALMAAAAMDKVDEAVAQDLELVAATLHASRDLRLLIASPIIRGPKKASVFKALFASRVNAHTLAFMDLLFSKQREGILEEAIDQYRKLRDIQQGIVSVGIVSAIAFNKQQEEALRAQLERLTGKKVRMHFALDPEIRGGIVVRVGDTVLDASVKHQLEILGERLTRGEFASAQATA